MASTTDYINLTIYQDESLEDTVTFESSFQIEDSKIIAKISKDYSGTAFTGDDEANKIVAYVVNNAGTGYTNGTHTLAISGGNGSGGADAVATCVISGQAITSVTITSAGTGYTSQPTVTLPSSAKTGSPDGKASISLLVGEAGYLTLNGYATQSSSGDTYLMTLSKSQTGALDDGFTGYWDLVSEDVETEKITRQVNGEVYLEKSIVKQGAFS